MIKSNQINLFIPTFCFNHQLMFTQGNSNLVGFLPKKSLFNQPKANRTPNKYSAKQDNEILSRTIKVKDQMYRSDKQKSEIREINVFRDHSERDFHKKSYGQSQTFDLSPKGSQNAIKGIIFKPNNRFTGIKRTDSSMQMQRKETQQFKPINPEATTKGSAANKYLKNMMSGSFKQSNYTLSKQSNRKSVASFESARFESQQCLKRLSFRLQQQLSTISKKLNNFNQQMYWILSKQLNTVKQRMSQVINEAFKESQQLLLQYIKNEQLSNAYKAIDIRQSLLKQLEKVELMRSQLQTQNWKKITGEMLSTDLEQRIQEKLNQAKKIQIKSWQYRQQREKQSKLAFFKSLVSQLVTFQK